MNELCFVWGPPMSGQRRWMAMAADDTDEKVQVSVLPLPDMGHQTRFVEVLEKLEAVIRGHRSEGRHNIYCELPWEMTQEGFLFEDWLGENPFLKSLQESAIDQNPWNISFLLICPADAERLPEIYRRGMEEFARASQSSVVVLSHSDGEEMPAWLGTDILDFGPRLEIFDEPIWEKDAEAVGTPHFFTNVDAFESVILPLSGGSPIYRNLLEELSEGVFGSIWGAEVLWKNDDGSVEALTFTQGHVYNWTSDHPDLVKLCMVNGATMWVAGFPLKLKDLQKSAIKSENFC
jgi:hypothetical protein